MSPRLTLLALAGISACVASAARADYTQGFESPGVPAGWTLSNGAAIVNTQHSGATGTHSLFAPAGGRAIVNIPGLSAGGVLTVDVLDQGRWATQAVSGNTTGWIFGLTPSLTGTRPAAPAANDSDYAGILIAQRTWMNSQNYAYSQGATDDDSAFSGTFSFWYNGLKPDLTGGGPGTTRTDLSATPDDGSIAADGGRWVPWKFVFDGAGNVHYYINDPTKTPGVDEALYSAVIGTVTGSGASQVVTPGPANSFFLYGGNGTALPGLYVDNINFVAAPEPASLSLLALGAAGLLLRRRRRA